jgi:hypothetical protein
MFDNYAAHVTSASFGAVTDLVEITLKDIYG